MTQGLIVGRHTVLYFIGTHTNIGRKERNTHALEITQNEIETF